MIKQLVFIVIFLFANMVFAKESLISVDAGKVREPIPGTVNTAGYGIFKNTSKTDFVIAQLRSEYAKKVEIHNHVMEDGMMKMVKLDQFVLDANSATEFSPGGLHIMFIGLSDKYRDNKQVTIILESVTGKEVSVTLPVKSSHAHHHH